MTTGQNAALSAEANRLALRNRQLTAANVLLKHFGGRWQTELATAR